MWFQWIVKIGCAIFGVVLGASLADFVTARNEPAQLQMYPAYLVSVLYLVKQIVFPIAGGFIGWAIGLRLTQPQKI
ncbi:MAG: hypothetical protein WBS22_12955 [Methylocystis sp.]